MAEELLDPADRGDRDRILGDYRARSQPGAPPSAHQDFQGARFVCEYIFFRPVK